MRYDLVAGDLVQLSLELTGVDPASLPLPAGTTANFAMVQADGSAEVHASATITSPGVLAAPGVEGFPPTVEYTFQTGDTLVSGVYRAQFQLVAPDGDPQTFPSDEELFIVIHPRL